MLHLPRLALVALDTRADRVCRLPSASGPALGQVLVVGQSAGDETVSIAAPYEIEDLLEQTGARARGNRHDCSKCGGLRTITHTEECFYCHRCQWKGNAVTLAKELGICQRIPKAEYIRQRKAREQAGNAAGAFLSRCRSERLTVYGILRELARLETAAHEAGPDHPAAWGALALIYRQRPILTAKVILLSEGSIADRRRWLEADTEGRERIAGEILISGGCCDDAGRSPADRLTGPAR